MLKKFIFSLTAVMALSLVVMAQDKGKEVSFTGNLVDQHCSEADMATHKRSCVTSDACLKSGLGVFADGKFHAIRCGGLRKGQGRAGKEQKGHGRQVQSHRHSRV